MEAKNYKGEILNFLELINKNVIEIPIIQRDYAQGRKDKKELRENFLNTLLDHIENEKPIKLDFIYGSIINNSFQPLDGQQRLTTLFLIYWYAAIKQNKLDEDTRNKLSRFSYETRITSRDFCNSLVNKSDFLIIENGNISSKIIDSNWFFLSWKNDPTIEAMLRAIDDIHITFHKVENLWDKLNSKNNLISFYYIELENIGLTDDLYIKMNARGKLLTPFENFKASFQKYIGDQKWEMHQGFQEKFAYKIDTIWTDYFWQHFKKNNTIGDAIMRFISATSMIRHSIERMIPKSDIRAGAIRKIQENPNIVRPEDFTFQGFKYLIEILELYRLNHNVNESLKLPFPLWRHTPENSILSEIVFDENPLSRVNINTATYTQKALFFAQTEYLRKNKITSDDMFSVLKFHDWMRVIRNIISRADIDKDGNRPDIVRSPEAFDGIINLINELAKGSHDIYSYLSSTTSLKSQFAKEQVEEEKLKAKLISTNPEYRTILFQAEDNELLRGKISFLFHCIDYTQSEDEFDIDKFKKVTEVFNTYFNDEKGLNNDLRRALLTININGLYEFYTYWWSYWNIIGATKRRLFDRFREIEYYINSEYRDYFKKLILLLLKKDLKTIANEFEKPDNYPNWKYRLVKETNLLDSEKKSNYIAITEDEQQCYLLKSKRPRDIEGCKIIE